MRMTEKRFEEQSYPPTGTGAVESTSLAQPFARAGAPAPTTANHVRRHGRPRSHTKGVQRIDHGTLDAVLKGMDQ